MEHPQEDDTDTVEHMGMEVEHHSMNREVEVEHHLTNQKMEVECMSTEVEHMDRKDTSMVEDVHGEEIWCEVASKLTLSEDRVEMNHGLHPRHWPVEHRS